ncbi:MAG TPA: VTT domain-containing protein [Clostridiaceae bacterium]|nr:VTT domain-containing protein [Clostridiaceae bacterium]
MNKKGNVKMFKLILLIMVLLISIGIIFYLFPVMKNLSTIEGQVAFKEKVDNSGVIGLLLLFGLQVAQIFLIIVPGEPIEILSGMCYGGLWGTVFIMVSASIISIAIYFLVRKFGRKFVYDFCDEKKVEKIENSKLFQNPKKIEFIMLILFLIPGTPKDLLVYVAGLLPIKPLKFILISTFARFPSVITSTLAGEQLAIGDWKMSIVLYGIILIFVAILVFIINKLDKDKITKEAINSIK